MPEAMDNGRRLLIDDIDLKSLLDYVYSHATSMKSRLHGENHWLRVTYTGLELARYSPDCDLVIVFLFGLLHDTQRLRDGRDPQHGERASHFVQGMNKNLLSLSQEQLKLLTYACHEHNNPKLSDDPTIGICWDADRLNLWRGKIIPQRKFLSTDVAKTWDMRFKALSIQFQSYTWQGLLNDYTSLAIQHRGY